MQEYSKEHAANAAKVISNWAHKVGAKLGQVIKVKLDNGQTVKGRFPACQTGISSIAGDAHAKVESVQDIKNFDPAKGYEQQFFYSHL